MGAQGSTMVACISLAAANDRNGACRRRPRNGGDIEVDCRAAKRPRSRGEDIVGEAKRGVYRIEISGFGSGTFRVEEYKKPEFEVSVKGPDKPVMLGDENTLDYVASRDAGFRVTWDPDADITPVENQTWGGVKALFR